MGNALVNEAMWMIIWAVTLSSVDTMESRSVKYVLDLAAALKRKILLLETKVA